MYKDFFGLKSSPFELSPDPFFMVSSDWSKEALASISSAIGQRKGFVVMTSEVGTGKTLILRCLFELWEREQIPFAYFIGPRLSATDFLSYINFELGITVAEPTKGNLLRGLYGFLLAQFEKGLTTVLVIDEAHQVSRNVLEEIRLLTNFETAQQKLVQIVLVGQPELDQKLDSVDLRSLKQRIAVRCKLEPLRPEEIRNYIERRLELAGADSEATTIFPVDTVKAIYHYSQGTPRLVNNICDQALITASASQVRVIPVEVIHEIATRFRLQPLPTHKHTERSSSPARQVADSRSAKSSQGISASHESVVKSSDADPFLLYLDLESGAPAPTTPTEKADASRKSRLNGYFSSYPRNLGQEAMDQNRLRQVLAEIDLESWNSNTNDRHLASALSTVSGTTSAICTTSEKPDAESTQAAAIGGESIPAATLAIQGTAYGPPILADDADDSQPSGAFPESARREPVAEEPKSVEVETANRSERDSASKRYDKEIVVVTLVAVFLLLALGIAMYLRTSRTASATSSNLLSEQIRAQPAAVPVAPALRRAASDSNSVVLSYKQIGQPSPFSSKSVFGPLRLAKPKVNRGTKSSEGGDLGIAPSMEGKTTGNLDDLSGGLAPLGQTVAPPSSQEGGGNFKPALLISSVAPVYPALAKNQRIHGDVRIDALIDAGGHVSSMKMLSGPLLLQSSASEALQHWKFQPATISGMPVPIHYTVTVQFRLK